MKPGMILLAAAILALLLLGGTVYIVSETQQVIITQFGRPVGDPVLKPGIKVKIPFIQKAHFFEKRFLEWNGDANEVPTKDKRFLLVDTYARWRITDPLKFFQRLQNERGALSRLDDIIDGETRNAVANHVVMEIVRSSNREVQMDNDLTADEQTTTLSEVQTGRLDIQATILLESQKRTSDLGIEILDVRFKRINYNREVQRTVYQRMIAERTRIAERFRSEGQGESARIRGEKERELKSIESDAFRQAEEIKGKADAQATSIYAAAYNQDPEFYQFYKTMEVYPNTLDKDTWLVLTTDSDIFRYLDGVGGRR
jgi:membrane protease subunit HflC